MYKYKIIYYDDWGYKHIVYGNNEYAEFIRSRFYAVTVRLIKTNGKKEEYVYSRER